MSKTLTEWTIIQSEFCMFAQANLHQIVIDFHEDISIYSHWNFRINEIVKFFITFSCYLVVDIWLMLAEVLLIVLTILSQKILAEVLATLSNDVSVSVMAKISRIFANNPGTFM